MKSLAGLILLCGSLSAFEPRASAVSSNALILNVRAERPSAVYRQGETVIFTVQAVENPAPAGNAELSWKLSKDGMPPIKTGKLELKGGKGAISGKLDEPGHLLCTVIDGGGQAIAHAGAAIDPLKIKPSMPVPDDFDSFWTAQIKRLSDVPMNVQMTRDQGVKGNSECFDVKVDCAGGTPVSGYYARPAGARTRSLPAILLLHGAGVGSSGLQNASSWSDKGFLALDMNAHGIPNGKPAEFYKELEQTTLKEYKYSGRESRETFYFLGMFLRVLRGADFLASQPEWDGKTIVAYGSSQGGFQAFAAAALDDRVSFIAAGVPAGCDHTGMVAGRMSGWPKVVPIGKDEKPDATVLQVARYFDCVNFAARTKAKAAFVTVGFIDQTCPATSVYAAYNALNVPKRIFNDIPTAHANSPEATRERNQAVLDYVKSVK